MKKSPAVAIIVSKMKDQMKNGNKEPKEQMPEEEDDYSEGEMFIEAFEKAETSAEKLQAFKDLLDYCEYSK